MRRGCDGDRNPDCAQEMRLAILVLLAWAIWMVVALKGHSATGYYFDYCKNPLVIYTSIPPNGKVIIYMRSVVGRPICYP